MGKNQPNDGSPSIDNGFINNGFINNGFINKGLDMKLLMPLAKNQARQHKSLNHLWQKVKTQAQLIEHIETTLAAIHSRYFAEIYEIECQVLIPAREKLVLRLTEFMGRKSLSHWHRQELADWISLEIDTIALLSEQKAYELTTSYNRAVAQLFPDLKDDPIDDPFVETESGIDRNKASLEDLIDTYREFIPESVLEEILNELNEKFLDAASPDSNEPFDVLEHSSSTDLDDLWLKKIFRRVANTLHPDKEKDPKLRQQKQHLMVKLTNARDNNDVATIIDLFMEHIGELDTEKYGLSVTDLMQKLQEQLHDLALKKDALIHRSAMQHYLYSSFYDKTDAKIDKKFTLYKDGIESIEYALHDLLDYLKNLDRLKEILAKREKQKALMLVDDFFPGFHGKDIDGIFN